MTFCGTSDIRSVSPFKESYEIPYGCALSQLIPKLDRPNTKSVIHDDDSSKWMHNTHDKSYRQEVLQYRLVHKSHKLLDHTKTVNFGYNIPNTAQRY